MASSRSRSGSSGNGDASPRGNNQGPDGTTGTPDHLASERELIVVAAASARLRAQPSGLQSLAAADTGSLTALLEQENIALVPLFGPDEEIHRERAAVTPSAALAGATAQLATFYRVQAPDDRLDALAARLVSDPLVTAAYVKPPTEPSAVMAPPAPVQPAVTPDFTARQGYLDPAPGGIEATWAATQAGGDGAGVQIIDVEGAWLFTHEDLAQNAGGVLTGTPTPDIGWRNHGTAVIGEFGADVNGFGTTGIAPGAFVRGASIFGGTGSANAIRQAADALNAGNIILLELHRPGPRFNFASRNDQRGYIAIEWWPDDLAAVLYATSKGIIVVGAGGNGAEDLDDPIYDAAPAGFPADWRNPFNPANPSSGAVIAGAGAPPPGTHGRDHGPDRSRLDFSNYGSRIDAQGWGREVTTTGYGDLQNGADERFWYTDVFSGTSSASPIVVGALAALQGIQLAAGRTALTPDRAREVLRATGSPQQDGPSGPATQRIGNRPDLRAAAAYLTPAVIQSGLATQYWEELKPYPPGPPPRLWLLVDNGWRHLDNPSDLVQELVQSAFLGSGSQVQVWYQADLVAGLVVNGS